MRYEIQQRLRQVQWFIPGHCWFMCYSFWRSLPANLRRGLVLVEGDHHYWLEDSEGNVYDPYCELRFHNYDYSDVRARYDLSRVSLSDYPESIWAEHANGNRGRSVSVRSLSNLEQARL